LAESRAIFSLPEKRKGKGDVVGQDRRLFPWVEKTGVGLQTGGLYPGRQKKEEDNSGSSKTTEILGKLQGGGRIGKPLSEYTKKIATATGGLH